MPPSTTPLLAAGAGLVALPVLAVAMFLGSGAADPPAPGTVCTVQPTTPPGSGPGVPPTGGPLELTADQVGNARVIVAATKAVGLPQQAAAIGVMTARQESSLLVLANPSVPDSESYPHQGDGHDHDSVGLFQQRPSQGWGTVGQLMDPGYASSAFLSALAQVPGWQDLPMWQAAQAVQRSADGTAYAQWQDLGIAVAAALWDGTDGNLVCTTPPGTGNGPLPPPGSPQAAVAIAYAQAQLGKPYQWGGTGPNGYDCSGLTMRSYQAAGIALPRTAETQWSVGAAVPTDQLSPGDLVFFNPGEQVAGLPGHVGIYLGNGLMIDAPHTGTVIRIEPVAGFGGYLGARRVA